LIIFFGEAALHSQAVQRLIHFAHVLLWFRLLLLAALAMDNTQRRMFTEGIMRVSVCQGLILYVRELCATRPEPNFAVGRFEIAGDVCCFGCGVPRILSDIRFSLFQRKRVGSLGIFPCSTTLACNCP
jgi:hypothetical protein